MERTNRVLRLNDTMSELRMRKECLLERLAIRCMLLYDFHDANNGRDFTTGVVEES